MKQYIFDNMNISESSSSEKLSQIFRAFSTPARLRILAAIGTSEACGCHLEAMLNMRQANISQQLMEMRDADLVDTRRDGRYIFYRLTEPQLLEMLLKIGRLFAVPTGELGALLNAGNLPQCECPECTSQKSRISDEEIKTVS